MSGTSAKVKAALKEFIDAEKAAFYPRFFKTGKGQYGEGDWFIGVTVPNQRKVVRQFRDLPAKEIEKLLRDRIHEHRLTGLLILVAQFERAKDEELQRRVVEVYMRNLDHVNNWDLVDSTAHKILGAWLAERDRDVLDELAASGHLWRERISVVACLHFIKQHDFDDILRLAEQFLDHTHDLIHKAVGWMLREAGNRNEQILEGFLSKHYSKMPRTMLRYAIERLKPARRKAYLEGRV